MAEHEDKKAKARPRGRAWWAEQIAACNKSGMTMVEYAQANGLNLSSLYRWKTMLHRKEKKTRQKMGENVSMPFVEVSVEKPTSSCMVEIVSPNGWTVRIPTGLDAEATLDLLALIGRQA